MTELLAADSWLVVDGRVRALDRHWARFSAACAEHGVDTQAFRADVERAVPAEGRWFPRVELRADGELAVRVRPAPPRPARRASLPSRREISAISVPANAPLSRMSTVTRNT